MPECIKFVLLVDFPGPTISRACFVDQGVFVEWMVRKSGIYCIVICMICTSHDLYFIVLMLYCILHSAVGSK